MSGPRYRRSAGVLLYRHGAGGVDVFLGHPGGPLWAHKDAGSWTIPKGEFDIASETPFEAALREFAEETSCEIDGDFADLGTIKQPSGKTVYVFALEGDLRADDIESNLFEMEWPPRSGKIEQHPEIDRAAWFPLADARERIMKGQLGFLDRLERLLAGNGATGLPGTTPAPKE